MFCTACFEKGTDIGVYVGAAPRPIFPFLRKWLIENDSIGVQISISSTKKSSIRDHFLGAVQVNIKKTPWLCTLQDAIVAVKIESGLPWSVFSQDGSPYPTFLEGRIVCHLGLSPPLDKPITLEKITPEMYKKLLSHDISNYIGENFVLVFYKPIPLPPLAALPAAQ